MDKQSVRAKFRIVSIKQTKYQDGLGYVIEMTPVVGNSEENKHFYKWTPSGRIELGTINENAAKQFEIDGEYYVDFTKSDN